MNVDSFFLAKLVIFHKQTINKHQNKHPKSKHTYVYIDEYIKFLLTTNLNISIKLGANHQHLRIQTLLKLLNFGKQMKFYKKYPSLKK